MLAQQSTAIPSRTRGTGFPPSISSASPRIASEVLSDVLRNLPSTSPRYVATAPGRLNVFGGLGEFLGGLILNKPLALHVCAGVQRRQDGCLGLTCLDASGGNGVPPAMIPFEAAAALHRSAAVPPSAAGRGPRRESSISVTARIVWLFEELTSAGLIRRSEWGLSVVVGTTFDDAHDYAADTALVAAVGCAAMRAMELEPDAKILAEALGRRDDGKRAGFGHPADLACALNAEAHALTGWSTTMPLEGETISLPEGVQLLGVDCGPIPPEAEVKRERARVAARMGIVLMNRILRHKEGLAHDGEAPGLRIATSDYVEHVRDRLPIQLKGAEFLERLGPLSDPGTPVEPELIYKVRSRTEHHVYELARAEQFVDLLRSARCPGDETLLRRAGDLMYASHWSHGQRCGLGSMETDLLVGAIRRSGESGGIFGAKITGGGCGGVVAVLLRDAPEAREALSHVLESFEQQTGRKPRVLRGSIPGVLKLGVQVL